MSERSAQIRILAVDDHVLVRQGISVLIGTEPDMRLSFHNPGINNVDFIVGKTVFVREGMTAVFRAEFYNLFNHTNFSDVDNRLTSPGFGTITQALDPRIVQLGLKFNF